MCAETNPHLFSFTTDTSTGMHTQDVHNVADESLRSHEKSRRAISYMDAVDKEKFKLEKSLEKSTAELHEWKLRSHDLEELLDEVEHIDFEHHRFHMRYPNPESIG